MLANPIIPRLPPERVSCTAAGLVPRRNRPPPFHGAGHAPHPYFCSCWEGPLRFPNAPSVLAEHGVCKADGVAEYNPAMGFNKRKMEDARKGEAEK